jgi:carboxymethylenebutenolidase
VTDDFRSQAIALYDRFTHEGMERRTFMARMVALAGSVAAAEALIAVIAADPAAAAIIAEDDKRLKTATIDLSLPGVPTYRAYTAEMKSGRRGPSVVIIHENRGLNAHTRDVARRMALAGFHAVAPDFLSPAGGTPADENKAREMIGKLDLGESVSHAVKHLQMLRQARGKKVGAVGFCWGGGFVNRLAVAAGDRLGAGVVYYGPAPDPADAAKVAAPLLLHHAGTDERVARTLFHWVVALRAAGKRVTFHVYDGAHHAFNNDTSAERYNKAAAELAWGRTVRFFRDNLA